MRIGGTHFLAASIAVLCVSVLAMRVPTPEMSAATAEELFSVYLVWWWSILWSAGCCFLVVLSHRGRLDRVPVASWVPVGLTAASYTVYYLILVMWMSVNFTAASGGLQILLVAARAATASSFVLAPVSFIVTAVKLFGRPTSSAGS